METKKCLFRRDEKAVLFCDSKGTGMLQKIWFQNNQAIVQGIQFRILGCIRECSRHLSTNLPIDLYPPTHPHNLVLLVQSVCRGF